MNNIKKTWKGIKSLIFLKSVPSSVPSSTFPLDNGDTITSPFDIANTFNKYLASIAETTKKAQNANKTFFQTVLQMKVKVQYFCNLMIKKKYKTSYLLSTLIRFLGQIVHLIEYYFFENVKFENNLQIHLTSLSRLLFFHQNSKFEK